MFKRHKLAGEIAKLVITNHVEGEPIEEERVVIGAICRILEDRDLTIEHLTRIEVAEQIISATTDKACEEWF